MDVTATEPRAAAWGPPPSSSASSASPSASPPPSPTESSNSPTSGRRSIDQICELWIEIPQKESIHLLPKLELELSNDWHNYRQDLGVVPGFGFGPDSVSEVVAANGIASMSEVIYGFEISSVLGIISNALLGGFVHKKMCYDMIPNFMDSISDQELE